MGLFSSKKRIEDGLTFVPQFAKVKFDHQPGSFAPLQVSWTKDRDPLLSSSEQQLMRILGTCHVMATRGRDGRPPRPGDAGLPFNVAIGLSDILVTTNRVVILVLGGKTALGNVDAGTGSMLVVVAPLGNFERVNWEKKWLNMEDMKHGASIQVSDIMGVDRGTGLDDTRLGVSEVGADLVALLASEK